MSTQTLQAPQPVKRRKAQVLPTKTTLNLAIKEKKELRLSRAVPAVLAVLAAVAVFGKFAVADRFAAAAAAEAAVDARRAELAAIRDSYADYAEVEHTYNQYTYTGFDRTIADRLDVMSLLERDVYPVCTVRSQSIAGKSVSLTISGLTLDGISDLIARLEAEPMVARVTVSTANYNGYYDAAGYTDVDVEPVANMTIALADAGPAPTEAPPEPANTQEGGE